MATYAMTKLIATYPHESVQKRVFTLFS